MTNKKNILDTSYGKNLHIANNKKDIQPVVKTAAAAPKALDTSYQNNSNLQYGGHDATWWQNQYASQPDAESQAMVKKAADYYGYNINLNNSQPVPQEQSGATNLTYAGNITGTTQGQPVSAAPVQQNTTQPVTQPIDSYEEFLRKRNEQQQANLDKTKESIEQNKQNTIEQAELQRQQAEQRAEEQRQRSVVDARSSYEQNKATYGQNAEQLAEMGLSNSGYSDYVNSQAYATSRQETQNANASAEATKQNAKYIADSTKLSAEQKALQDNLNAEITYGENIANTEAALAEYKKQQEENKKSYFTELLTYANNGNYSAEQLSQLGTNYGLSAEQIEDLQDAANTYKSNQQAANFDKFLQNADTSGFDTIKSALDNGSITQDQYDKLVSTYQTYYYDSYKSNVNADFSTTNTDEIDTAFSKGHITQEQYDSLKEEYNKGLSNAIDAASVFYINGEKLAEEDAQAIIKELKDTGWLSADNITKINNLYDSAYKSGGGGCFAKGTLITLPDGTQTEVENVKVGDNIAVFNHFTGEIDIAPVSFIFYDSNKVYKVLKLTFDNGAEIKVLYGHGFFDADLRKYVLIDGENATEFIGHKFCNISLENGLSITTLTNCEVCEEETECFSILTSKHINCITNGILTITDDGERPAGLLQGFYNIFDLDENYKYDSSKMAADIAKYGLFGYYDWKEFVTKEQFEAFNGAYLRVAIGKGLATSDRIVDYIKKFLQ